MSEPQRNEQPERNEQGQFANGNKGGPGNPFARRVAELRSALLAIVTCEDLAEILKALIEKAKKGDNAAARLVLSYTLGKPLQSTDPDRLDAHEWAVQKETAGLMNEVEPVASSATAAVPLYLARNVRPIMDEVTFHNIREAWFDLNPDLKHMKKDYKPKPAQADGSAKDEKSSPDSSSAPVSDPERSARVSDPAAPTDRRSPSAGRAQETHARHKKARAERKKIRAALKRAKRVKSRPSANGIFG